MQTHNSALGPTKSVGTTHGSRTLAMFFSLLLFCSRVAADSIQPQFPPEVALNKDAGRGGWVFVTLRTDMGEELPVLMDTGAPVTVLDKSLAPKLGNRLSEGDIFLLGKAMDGGEYFAPKLCLGGIPLTTGTNVLTCDLKRLRWLRNHSRPTLGILGMDCLRHYCIQLDLEAGKLRFLDSHQRDVSALGKSYPLILTPAHAGPTESIYVFINHIGLCGGRSTRSMIDTGMPFDGMVEKGTVGGHYWQRFKSLLAPSRATLGLAECVWDGQTYKQLRVRQARNGNALGLRFLARHLVTFDFPNGTMYLKQTSTGPLSAASKR
jgi:hypothetical protein